MKNNFIDKIIDLFMFRIGTEETEDGGVAPVITTGSIAWGVILRITIIVALAFLLFDSVIPRKYLWISLLGMWFFAAYPGFRQYQVYKTRIQKIEEETLCGTCRHFDNTSQLCKIYDQHVTHEYIPCEGTSWEPFSYEDK